MMLNDPHSRIVISSEARNLCHSRLRDSRFPYMCLALLRFPHLSFMPLEPYPARYARHLPHAGKALSVVILFPHMRVFALTLWGKRVSRIVAFPAWGRGTAPAVDRVLSLTAHLRRNSLLAFIPRVPYSPLRGTFPSRGRLFILAAKPPPSFLIPHSGRAFIQSQGEAHPTG